MSFNQKVIGAITVLVVLVTVAVALVCFPPPYSANNAVALGALVLSELILGGALVLQSGRGKDAAFPVSIGGWAADAGYVLFTLLCTCLTKMDTAYYMLVQFVGLVLFVIVRLMLGVAVHHVKEMSKDDEPEQKIERAKVTWR